jgi:hypothetical protein
VSEKRRLLILEKSMRSLDLFLSLLVQQCAHDPAAVRAAFDAVLRRKGVALDLLRLEHGAILAARSPQVAALWGDLHSARAALSRYHLTAPDSPEAAGLRQQLGEWEKERARLQEELSRQVRGLDIAGVLRTADRRTVAARLPSDSVLVEFVRFRLRRFGAVAARGEPLWGPDRYLAFVLHAGGTGGGEPDLRMIDLGDAEPIDRLLGDFRTAVTGDRGESRDVETVAGPPVLPPPPVPASEGERLRRAVFDPLLPCLSGRSRLLLAPAAALTQLPFEALPAGRGRFLIDQYRISYRPPAATRFASDRPVPASRPRRW